MMYDAGIDVTSANGHTPLHEAAISNSARVAKVGDAFRMSPIAGRASRFSSIVGQIPTPLTTTTGHRFTRQHTRITSTL